MTPLCERFNVVLGSVRDRCHVNMMPLCERMFQHPDRKAGKGKKTL